MSFRDIIFAPTLPRQLSRLRYLLTTTLTTSRTEIAAADAIGYYCTVTELRPVVFTLLKASPDDFARTDRSPPVEAFQRLLASQSIFNASVSELEVLGVSRPLVEMLVAHFEAESPVHGLAAASIVVFFAARIADV